MVDSGNWVADNFRLLVNLWLRYTDLRKVMSNEQTISKTAVDLVEIDLKPIFFKIDQEGELVNGEAIDPESADLAYRRFLTLRKLYPHKTLVPSGVLDRIWHYHILDTRKYFDDCDRIFGRYIHHDPYFGNLGEEDKRENELAWEETQRLWFGEFGEPMTGARSHRCSTKDCR